ncbi:putative RNA-dependent RNA polymerase 5 [Forsythia ovata]|uniref:RNA-dependent RNA polymerase n=1 Tax=Forsythia ovata TaxID=205694 RepID=A0ABD1SMN9_9LAMI
MEGGPQDVPLPEPVEMIIARICQQQSQPPLKPYARSLLAAIGEQASIEVLTKISSSRIKYTFTGYIRKLVMDSYPIQGSSVLAAYNYQPSPLGQKHLSPPATSCYNYNSPQKKDGESSQRLISMCPMNSPSSSSERAVSRTIKRHLSYNDETEERTSPHKAICLPSFPNEIRERASSLKISQQLRILSKLEYRKLFLVLSYIGRQNLETCMTLDDANDILSIKDAPMTFFESNIWSKYGQHLCTESDRSQYFDWDSGKTHLYYCHVYQDGSHQFKGPYLNTIRTHLQRVLGDENVLIVKFPEDGICGTNEEGILVGLRRFRFFVFKDEFKRKKKNPMNEEKKATDCALKCYFIRVQSMAPCSEDESYILSRRKISEARSLFMHIHMVSTIEKYMARFSLILSKTIKLQVDFDSVKIERIEDIPFRDENRSIIFEDGKPLLHTDGTGYISENLAVQCPKDFCRSKYAKDENFEKGSKGGNMEPPLLMQCRMFYNGCAVKGTLLVNKKLEPGKIQIRPSMIKVETDSTLLVGQTFNSLEIVAISHKPGRTFLSRYLIALLTYGGVPADFFLNLVMNALEEAQSVYSNKRSALRVASNHNGIDDGFMAQRMISSGIPLNEPYLQFCLSRLVKDDKSKLKTGRIPIGESFYLMGTADPTAVLNNDEVCVILDSGQISGKVLVYRNPGLHFGDIHVLEAVYVKELEDVVGNAKYGIFFSAKGKRSAAYEMATGDFDGDMYWVSRNPELLKYFKASEPWSRSFSIPDSYSRKPQDFSDEELEHELFRCFLKARKPSFNMATAADSWLTFMDRLLMLGDNSPIEKDCLKRKIIELIDIYYEALDAPKSGKKVHVPDRLKAESYPHYMGRTSALTYHSTSILGQIFDRIESSRNENLPSREIWKLPCFDIEIPEIYLDMWKNRYDAYRVDMAKALNSGGESKNESADAVIRKYKQLLYDAPEMEESRKNTEDIYKEALAIYHVTYKFAESRDDIGKCKFVWSVAGTALCEVYAWNLAGSKERPFIVLPSVMREILN